MAAMIHTNCHIWQPLLKLPEPVLQGASGHNDEVRSSTAAVEKMGDERHALTGLAEAHFV